MRQATAGDIPQLIGMARQFHDAVQPEWPWSSKGIAATFDTLTQVGFVSITEGGFLAGVMHPMPISPTWLQAHEQLWWATDNSGPQHIKAFRKWAIYNDAHEIKWSCRAENARVQKFYSKFSQRVEAVYSEVL